MTGVLEQYFERYLPIIEEDLKTVLTLPANSPELFYRMFHYHMGWVDEHGKPDQGRGGKRLRPVLCLLVSEAISGSCDPARPAAAAVELIHNFSLLHDDVQDHSLLRRNQPTVWSIWGIEQAINAGDAMFALAHLALPRLAEQLQLTIPNEMFLILDETCLELTRGQHLDMTFETYEDVTAQDYLDMIAGKTSALIAASAQMGAIAGGAKKKTQRHYRDFGKNLGMAFQILDDVLDIWGDPAQTGKQAAIDIYQRKRSLPVVYVLMQSDELRDIYNKRQDFDDDTVRHVIELLDEAGARAYAEDLAQQYSDQTLSNLEAASPQGEAGQALFEIIERLLHRKN
jgi:geranylgeranyl diphosphate synthase type I